jgi:hypothetical protein
MYRLLLALPLLVWSAPAGADPGADAVAPGVTTYALIVGSNPGGPGQGTLRFAEDDARGVAQVLRELGDLQATPGNLELLVHPSPDELRLHLAALGAKVTADLAAGRQSRVFFYYSGHARAAALDLGTDELPLGELRQRLLGMPATLTVVVLDACQSGAFSRIKGAAPAADFSFSSRQQLDARGVAVLSSSTGSELSQESEQLRSSYFTHHFLVGLRGAGDANGDGQVSLDEAYRYAYHQTLLATAATAVGGQHVSLEVDLKGHGEIALSYPRARAAAIVLPAAMLGQATISDLKSHTVVAETAKARGAAVRIAVAPGSYEVMVRDGEVLRRCDVTAGAAPGDVEVTPASCRTERVSVATGKGGGFARPYLVELAAGLDFAHDDAFTRNLTTFGYDGSQSESTLRLAGLRQVYPALWVGAAVADLGSAEWSRATEVAPLRFSWDTYLATAIARGELALGDDDSRWHAFLQAGLGVAVGRTRFVNQDNLMTVQTFVGPAAALSAGLRLDILPPQRVGVTAAYTLDAAPAIHNLVGETHYSGGQGFHLGLTLGF